MTPESLSIKQNKAKLWEIILVTLLPLAFFSAAILPATSFNDIDGFYHYKVAQLIGDGKPWVDIRWLPFTVLGPNGPDHHWLFHVLIAPFTWIGDDILGIKVAVVVTASLIVPVLFFLLRKWQVPYAWLFALLSLFGGLSVPWRFEMLRAQGLSLVCICFFIFFLVQHRHLAMLLMVWGFFNAYHGSVIIIPIFFCFLVLQWLQSRQVDSRTLIVFLIGVVLALVLNPWYPKNIEYLLFHTLYKMANHFADNVGAEWLGYPLKNFLVDNLLLHAIWLILLSYTARGILKQQLSFRQIPMETLLFLLLSVLMFFATLSSNRFIEYYAPFSAISSGLLLRDIFLRDKSCPADAGSSVLNNKTAGNAAAFVTGLLLLVCMGLNLFYTRSQQIFDITTYKPLATYLGQNVPKGSLIFNSAWSDFPQLLWYTTDYPMANGLDIHYLAYGDPERFTLWFKVTQLHEYDSPDVVRSIARSFNTHWILVHKADYEFAKFLADSHEATLRFDYSYGWLFEITPSPATSP